MSQQTPDSTLPQNQRAWAHGLATVAEDGTVLDTWYPAPRLGDATGLWVLTPLRLPDGSGVPVVRGWVPDAGNAAADPGDLPGGDVDITGVLQPTEDVTELDPGGASEVPSGQVALAAAPLLVQRWPYPLVTGYVVQTAASPAPATALAAVPPSTGSGGLALQNLSYAFQWWAFSAFGIFFWWRIVRDAHHGRLRPADADEPSDGGPP